MHLNSKIRIGQCLERIYEETVPLDFSNLNTFYFSKDEAQLQALFNGVTSLAASFDRLRLAKTNMDLSQR